MNFENQIENQPTEDITNFIFDEGYLMSDEQTQNKDAPPKNVCKGCDEEFDEDIRKPLVLLCGHTFCQICLFDN